MNTIISPYVSARQSIASIRSLSEKIGQKDAALQDKLHQVDKQMMVSEPRPIQAPAGVKEIRQEVEAMKTERTKTALKLPFKAIIAPFKVLANGGVSLAVNGGMLYMIGYEGLLQGQIRLSNEELDQRIELIGQESDKYRDAIVKWVR